MGIGVATTALALAAPRLLAPLAAVERWLTDVRVAWLTPAAAQQSEVVVLGIDEATLARLPHRSPVDRAFLAEIVAELRAKGVRAIGIDLLFDQPTRPRADAALRAALRAPGAPVVVAYAGERVELTEAQRQYQAAFTGEVARGHLDFATDAWDGVVRRQLPLRDGAEVPYSFAGALAAAVGVEPPPEELAIVYRAGPGTAGPFPIFPAYTVPLLKDAWLAGKIALIGPLLPQEDRHRTPLSLAGGRTPGVLIHAHALAQLLDGARLPLLGTTGSAILVAALVVAGLALAVRRDALSIKLMIAAALVAGLWVGAFALYGAGGPLVPLLAPSLGFGAATGVGSAYAGRRHRAQKRFIRRAFGRFLAPAVVRRLEAEPERLVLGGERRDITTLFTDLQGFTSLCESLEPDQLVPLLNGYLDGLIRVVLEHEGTIDKIVGDAVHAMFNAPDDQPDHPRRAVRCALALDAFGQAFAAEQRAQGLALGVTRIGVHTGPAVVGNFGGSQRFDYTAHGDTVNTAARLEGANKAFGTRICVSGACAERCPELPFRPIGELVLVGKAEPIAAFEPLATPDATYGAAYELLKRGDAGAAAAFARLLASAPDHALAAFHHARLLRGEAGARIVLGSK